jgi:hypothetical protein
MHALQGASGTVYRAVYDPSLALSGRDDADDDDLGLSVVRSTCTVAVKKMKISPTTNMKALVNEIRLMRESRSAVLLSAVNYADSYAQGAREHRAVHRFVPFRRAPVRQLSCFYHSLNFCAAAVGS